MVEVLELITSIFFFANKAFLLAGKRTGWLIGSIAAVLGIAYFYLLDFYVYTVLQVGLMVLMSYGFLKKERASRLIEVLIHLVMVATMLLMASFAFKGMLTIIEFAVAITVVLGTYFLTHKRVTWGWFFYVIAHTLAVIPMQEKMQFTAVDFQIASAIVSIVGVLKGNRRQ